MSFCKLDNSSILQFAEKQPLQKIFDLVQLLATHLEIVTLTFIVLMWHLLSCILLPIEMSLHMIMFIFWLTDARTISLWSPIISFTAF